MKPASVVVKYRTVSITVFPITPKPGLLYWKFHVGKKTVVRNTLEKAKAEAQRIAQETFLGSAKLGFLSDSQTRAIRRMLEVDPSLSSVDEFLVWHRRKYPTITVAKARDEFLATKRRNAGASAYNVQRLRQRLEHLPGDSLIARIMPADLPALDGAPRTRRNHIAAWTTFFRWCRKQGYLPAGEETAPERLERPQIVRAVPETWTRQELETILANCSPRFLPFFAIAAWAGCRSEEIAPDIASKKDGIRWEDFAWDRMTLIVRADVSKTGQRRLVPICDALAAVLRPLAGKGRVIDGLPPHRSPARGEIAETARLGKLLGGWKRNALRHSYVSYRSALIGIAGAAMECGNSEAVSRRNYHDAMSKADAVAWFAPIAKQGKRRANPLRVVGQDPPKRQAASKRSA